MKGFSYYNPTRIEFGRGVLNRLPKRIPLESYPHVALICGASAHKSGLAAKVAALPAKCSVLTEPVPEEPNSDDVDRFTLRLRETNADLVIGLGGGSVMDLTKVAAYLSRNGGRCGDHDPTPHIDAPTLPMILIPTTAGTGSEVTPYAVINHAQSGKKFTVNSPHLFPRWAVVDPDLTRTLPERYRLATGLDAWVHNLEAFLSATPHPMADCHAKEGLALIFKHLPRAMDDPDDGTARTALAKAALWGGLAITHARTGLVHTLSVALAKYSNLPHGLLNATITPHVIAFNLAHYAKDRIEALGELLQVPEGDREAVLVAIHRFLALLQVPYQVPLTGKADPVTDSLIARVRMDKGLPLVNPRPITDRDLADLFGRIIRMED